MPPLTLPQFHPTRVGIPPVDNWHDNYRDAPVDGSAWKKGKEEKSFRDRVVRGGSWDGNPWDCRSACRGRDDPDLRNYHRGFRVARTLS